MTPQFNLIAARLAVVRTSERAALLAERALHAKNAAERAAFRADEALEVLRATILADANRTQIEANRV